MGFNIRNYIEKQSIIQLTLLKVILSIFSFLIIFILFYGQNFWEKQTLKYNYELLSNASNIQTKIQSNINSIKAIKLNKDLTMDNKKLQIKNTVQIMLNNNEFIEGYYDNELQLLIRNRDDEVQETDSKVLSLKDLMNETTFNKVIKVVLPIYDNGAIIGYVWAYTYNEYLVLMSFYELSAIIILALTLSAIIIIFIRKHMKEIESYMGEFCNIICNNDSRQHDNILIKLPELKPVLNKITCFTNDLKQMNLTLEISRLNIMKIMEGISDGFYALDRDWKFTFVNHRIKLVTNSADLVGKSIWEVFPDVVNTLTYEKMQAAMSHTESVHWEAGGLANPDQKHEFHAYPYKEGLTVFFRDITESKRQQQELGRLERLNLIGQLAAGISHEIRNPLTTVKGFLQFFGSKPQYDNDKEYMELMIAEIDRANTIITDFLSLAKANSDNMKAENLNEVINKVLPMLQADAYNNNKEVIVDLSILPNILINENEIKQLILNLVRNGLEATGEHGQVMISTHLNEDKVVLAIKDQGKGIPYEIQEKIGTPFFTTKDSGTGLGLAISMGIAQRHGAMFEFKTGPEGTVFYTIFSIRNLI